MIVKILIMDCNYIYSNINIMLLVDLSYELFILRKLF